MYISSQYKQTWAFIKTKLLRLFWFSCGFVVLISLLSYWFLQKHPDILQTFVTTLKHTKHITVPESMKSSHFLTHLYRTYSIFINNTKVDLLYFILLGLLPFMCFSTVIKGVNAFGLAAALIAVSIRYKASIFKLLVWGIMPHGIFELCSWFLAAAIGLYLNITLSEAIMKKTHDPMKYAFKNAGASFLLFVFPLTLFAAFVEAFAFATPLFIKAFLN